MGLQSRASNAAVVYFLLPLAKRELGDHPENGRDRSDADLSRLPRNLKPHLCRVATALALSVSPLSLRCAREAEIETVSPGSISLSGNPTSFLCKGSPANKSEG